MSTYPEDNLEQLPKLVAQSIRDNVPDVVDADQLFGKMDAAVLKRMGAKSPAVRVAFIGMRSVDFSSNGQMVGPATLAIYIITKDKPRGESATESALRIARIVADHVSFNNWGREGVAGAQIQAIENLGGDAVDQMGLALFGVGFSQKIVFGRDRAEEEIIQNVIPKGEALDGLPNQLLQVGEQEWGGEPWEGDKTTTDWPMEDEGDPIQD